MLIYAVSYWHSIADLAQRNVLTSEDLAILQHPRGPVVHPFSRFSSCFYPQASRLPFNPARSPHTTAKILPKS